MVLGFGNYLNAGTTRGRADGFSVEAELRTRCDSATLQQVLPQMRTLKGQAASCIEMYRMHAACMVSRVPRAI